jgi:hypothetical protein
MALGASTAAGLKPGRDRWRCKLGVSGQIGPFAGVENLVKRCDLSGATGTGKEFTMFISKRLLCLVLGHQWLAQEQADLLNHRAAEVPVVTCQVCRRCGAERQFACDLE